MRAQLRKGMANTEKYFRGMAEFHDRVYGESLLNKHGMLRLGKELACWEDLVMRGPEQPVGFTALP